METRTKVLSVYKYILKLSRTWVGKNPDHVASERTYILNETRNLFRANKKISRTEDIKRRIEEAEARIAIAEHYGIPYPRPVYTPPNILAATDSKKRLKFQERIQQDATPVYMQSQLLPDSSKIDD